MREQAVVVLLVWVEEWRWVASLSDSLNELRILSTCLCLKRSVRLPTDASERMERINIFKMRHENNCLLLQPSRIILNWFKFLNIKFTITALNIHSFSRLEFRKQE